MQFTFEALDPNRHVVTGALFTVTSDDSDVVSIDDRFLATAIGNGDTAFTIRADWVGQSPGAPAVPGTAYMVRVRQVAASIDIESTAYTFRNVDESQVSAL